ncbi:hypothetical protein F4808DRAFT_323312 [Astrocystis sublimbata]|nr:hypothetical protein F4808DRAFT_323312 [Astrocystis sublimbata]
MAQVSIRTELMPHMVGSPMPTVDHLHTIDLPKGPLLVFVDKSSSRHFKVIRPGNSAILDLTRLWKLTAPVTHISVSQNSSGTIFLAFACTATDPSQADQVFATHGIPVEDIDNDEIWTKRLISAMPNQPGSLRPEQRIAGVYMGPASSLGRPYVIVSYHRTPTATDIAQIAVSSSRAKTFTYSYPSLPSEMDANPELQVAPGVVNGYNGFFAAYKQGGQQTLTFVSSQQNYGYATYASLVVQKDVKSIHAVPGPDGNTDLLVAGNDGVFLTTAEDARYSGSQPKCIVPGTTDHIRVSPSAAQDVTIVWAVRNTTTFGYVEVRRPDYAVGEFVTLLQGDLSHVSPTATSDASIVRLIYSSSDSGDQLHMLERNASDIWTTKPLRLPLDTSSDTLEEMPAYVTHIAFTDSRNVINAAGRDLLLTCSSSASVVVNGQPIVVDKEGVIVTTDHKGRLELVNPVTTIAAPQFEIKNAPGDQTGPALLETSQLIDVTSAVLGKVLTSDGSRVKGDSTAINAMQLIETTIKDSDGKTVPLFPELTDFTHLANVLGSLLDHAKTLRQDGSRIKIPPLESIITHPWDVLHWVQAQASALTGFIVKEGHLLITIAGQKIAFAIECLEHGLQAAWTVLKAAGAELWKCMQWFGWLFEWDDILATQRTLTRGMSVVFDATDGTIDTFINEVIGGIGSVKRSIERGTAVATDSSGAQDSPLNQANDPQTAQLHQSATGGAGEQPLEHPSIHYIMNKVEDIIHFFNGLGDSDGDGDAADQNSPVMKGFEDFRKWMDTDLPKILQPIEANIQKVHDDLIEVFSKGGKLTIAQALAKLGGDILITFATAIEQMFIYGVKPLLHMLLRFVRDSVTAGISVPFFSPLWKKITGLTTDPSLLDLAMLIIAIPTTILAKLTTNRTIPELSTEDFAHFLPASTSAASSDSNPRARRSETSHSVEEDLVFIQAFARPLINLLLITCQAADGLTDIVKSRLKTSQRKEAFMTTLKLMNNISGFPIIKPGDVDAAQALINTHRRTAYAMETAFLGWDLAFSWIAAVVADFDKDGANLTKSGGQIVNCCGTVFMLVNQETIAWNTIERVNSLRDKDSDANKKVKTESTMRMVELIFFGASRFCRAGAQWAKTADDKKAIVATNVCFWASGFIADGLMFARGEYRYVG